MTNPRSRSKRRPQRKRQTCIQKRTFTSRRIHGGGQICQCPSKKLVERDLYDVRQFFHRGAHMPLMLFIGDRNRTTRSKEAYTRRGHAATARHWGPQRRADFAKSGGGDWRTIEQETDAKWNHSSSSSWAWQWKEGWSSTQ